MSSIARAPVPPSADSTSTSAPTSTSASASTSAPTPHHQLQHRQHTHTILLHHTHENNNALNQYNHDDDNNTISSSTLTATPSTVNTNSASASTLDDSNGLDDQTLHIAPSIDTPTQPSQLTSVSSQIFSHFLTLLQQQRSEYELNNDYKSAQLLQGKMHELREHEEARRRAALASKQYSQLLDLEDDKVAAYEAEVAKWTAKEQELIRSHDRRLQSMLVQHVHNLELFMCNAHNAYFLRPKFSTNMLDIRRIQQVLAQARKYDEAHAMKLRGDALEANELELMKQAFVHKIEKKRAAFIAKQQEELAGFQQRCYNERLKLTRDKLCALENELLARFTHARQNMMHAHTLETSKFQRAEQLGTSTSQTVREQAPVRTYRKRDDLYPMPLLQSTSTSPMSSPRAATSSAASQFAFAPQLSSRPATQHSLVNNNNNSMFSPPSNTSSMAIPTIASALQPPPPPPAAVSSRPPIAPVVRARPLTRGGARSINHATGAAPRTNTYAMTARLYTPSSVDILQRRAATAENARRKLATPAQQTHHYHAKPTKHVLTNDTDSF